MNLSDFKIYRRYKGGIWHKHVFTNDATQLALPEGKTFWARYGEINRHSRAIETETPKNKN